MEGFAWHGFGAHRDCARQEEARETSDRLDNNDVIRTSTSGIQENFFQGYLLAGGGVVWRQ